MEIGENLSWKNKIRKENRKFGEREIRQMGFHEEGIQEKWILGKREIGKKYTMGKKEINRGGNLEKQKFVKRGFWKNKRREN